MRADVRRFLAQREPRLRRWTSSSELYQGYCDWAERGGFVPLSHAAFGTDLGVYITRTRRGTGNYYSEHDLEEFSEFV